MNKLTDYIQASYEEMKKVTWPTWKETRNYTLMVILVSVGVAGILGGFDFIFNWLIKLFLNR